VIYLQEERGLSLGQVTGMEGPFWVAMVLLEVPTGVVADRFGRRVSLLCSRGVWVVAVFVFAVAGNYTLLFASYLAFALSETLRSGADSALVYDSFKAIGKASTYQQFWGRAWAVEAGAASLAVLVAGPVAAQFGLQFPILFDVGLAVAGLLITFTLVEPPRFDDGEREGMIATTRTAARYVWRSPVLVATFAVGAIMTTLAFAGEIFVQPFIRSFDISLAVLGPLMVVHTAGATAGALASHRITTAIGIRGALVLLTVLLVVGYAFLGAIDHIGAFAFYPVIGFAGGLLEPAFSDFINRRVPSSRRATTLSLFSLSYSLVLAPVLPLSGLLADAEGLRAAYAAFAVALLVVGLPLLFWLFRRLRNEPPGAASLFEDVDEDD
jgi:MFS family permease